MRNVKRKKELGEVFTPPELIEISLNELPKEIFQSSAKTFLDNSCGNGNFLVAIKERLLQYAHSEENALSRIYGVDIMEDNVEECKQRLDPDNKYSEIVNQNIVCADALTYHYRFDGSSPGNEGYYYE